MAEMSVVCRMLVLSWLKERRPKAHWVIEVVPDGHEVELDNGANSPRFSVTIYYWDDDWEKCVYEVEGTEMVSLWNRLVGA